MEHNEINYKGVYLTVRTGAWDDIMNSCFYKVIDAVVIENRRYFICVETGRNELFARNDYNY